MKIPSTSLRVVVTRLPGAAWKMSDGSDAAAEQKKDIPERHATLRLRTRMDRGSFLPTPELEQSLPSRAHQDIIFYMPFQQVSVEPCWEAPEGKIVGMPLRPARPAAIDAREYLDGFLGISDAIDALRFLNKYGSPDKAPFTTLARIRELQALVRKAALIPLEKWKERLPSWAFPEKPESYKIEIPKNAPPAFVYGYEWGGMACFAQIFFERMAGSEFALCELEGCGVPFVKTRFDKKHCCIDHQHLAVIRRSRKNAKKNRKRGTR